MIDKPIPGVDSATLQKLVMMAIGNRSQKAFAETARMNEALLSQLATGHLRSRPSVATLRKIADASEKRVPLNDLLTAAGYAAMTNHQLRQMDLMITYANALQQYDRTKQDKTGGDRGPLPGYALPSAFLRQLNKRGISFTVSPSPLAHSFSLLQENGSHSSDLYLEPAGYAVGKWFVYTRYLNDPGDYAPALAAFLARCAFLSGQGQLLSLVINDPAFFTWLPALDLKAACAMSLICLDLEQDQITRERWLSSGHLPQDAPHLPQLL